MARSLESNALVVTYEMGVYSRRNGAGGNDENYPLVLVLAAGDVRADGLLLDLGKFYTLFSRTDEVKLKHVQKCRVRLPEYFDAQKQEFRLQSSAQSEKVTPHAMEKYPELRWLEAQAVYSPQGTVRVIPNSRLHSLSLMELQYFADKLLCGPDAWVPGSMLDLCQVLARAYPYPPLKITGHDDPNALLRSIIQTNADKPSWEQVEAPGMRAAFDNLRRLLSER
jgi:hypothetical protein